ncbi:hypothetical protein OSG_eHP25_00050 [environmental Halophage eHP-25]|nr:hypothetical protein OSG_eHP25_00050 [environmental Halophage eHP-25]
MPIVTIEDEEGNTNEVEVPTENIKSAEDDADLVIKRQEELNDSFSKRARRAEKSALKDIGIDPENFDELNEDEAFRTLAEKRGIELRDDGKPKGSVKDDEIQELKQKASKVDSLKSQLEQYESQIQSTRETELENKLLQKTEGFQGEQAKKTYLREAKTRMSYDDEYGWVETDEDGDILYEAGQPRGVEAVTNDLRETHNFLFKSTEVNGGSSATPGGDSSGKKVWTEQEWENASKRTHQMNDKEFEDWDSAKEEGRVR